MKILSIIFLLFISFPILSQTTISSIEVDTIKKRFLTNKTPYFEIRKGNKFGFVYENGQTLVPIKYNIIKKILRNDFLYAQKGKRNYLINLKNGEVILRGFDELIDTYGYGPLKISKKGKFGLFSPDLGKLVVPIKFDFIENDPHSSNLKILHKGKFVFLYFTKPDRLVQQKFDSIDLYGRSSILICTSGKEKSLYHPYKGELLFKIEASDYKLGNGYYAFFKNDKWKIIPSANPTNDKYNLAPEFDNFRYTPERGGAYFVKRNNKWGVLNLLDQSMVLETKYDSLSIFAYEAKNKAFYKTYSTDHKIGLIDPTGKVLIPTTFEDVGLTYNLTTRNFLFWVKVDNYYSPYVDGQVNSKVKYDTLVNPYTRTRDNILVKNKNGYGIYSSILQKEIMPCVNDTIYEVYGRSYVFKRDHKFGLFAENGEILLNNEYASFKDLDHYFIRITDAKGKIGIYSLKDQKIVLDLIYDDLEWIFGMSVSYMIRKGQYSGIFNLASGQFVVPLEYDEIMARGADFIDDKVTTRAKKNGKWGWMDIHTGEIILPYIYDDVKSFNRQETTDVRLKYRWLSIDKKGNEVK